MKYTIKLARTTKDPKILVDIIRQYGDEPISYMALVNKYCPIEMIIEILKRDVDDWLSCLAVTIPQLPSEILEEILKKGKDDWVSSQSIRNPNCPYEARINWMIKTGKIGKEDPKKHIIEYEKIKEDDFQDLKDLL